MFDASEDMRTVKILERSLDTAILRQQVIADNMANVNTPDFKRSYVDFEWRLREAMKGVPKKLTPMRTHPRHLNWVKIPDPTKVVPRTQMEYDTWLRNDQSNVDINKEMADMAKNSIMYESLVTRISGSFRVLMDVIRGGR